MFAPLAFTVIMMAPFLFEKYLFSRKKRENAVVYYHVFKLFDNPYVITEDQVCIILYDPETGKESMYNINQQKEYSRFKKQLCNVCKNTSHVQFITYNDGNQRVVLSNAINGALAEEHQKKPQLHFIDLKKWYYRLNDHVTVTTLADTLCDLNIPYEHNRSSIVKIYKHLHTSLKEQQKAHDEDHFMERQRHSRHS